MMYPEGFDCICITLPRNGIFTIGKVYHIKENQMNDIVWFTCDDDTGNSESFYEWNGLEKFFRKI